MEIIFQYFIQVQRCQSHKQSNHFFWMLNFNDSACFFQHIYLQVEQFTSNKITFQITFEAS